MKIRLVKLVEDLRASYWFIPSLMALGSLVLAFVMIQVDQRVDDSLVEGIGWVYTGGAEGARSVLSTIAGSMITVAGVVFSITIVALSLASQQFGPRLLNSFMRDRSVQIVLGTFIATFLYCLMVMRTIVGEQDSVVVPQISVTVGVVLALASLGVLIYFIHHTSVSIQAPHVIAAVAHELHHGIDKLFPQQIGEGEPEERGDEAKASELFERDARPIRAKHNGYIEAVDQDGLMELATEHDLLICLEQRPGNFAMRGEVIACAWPPDRLNNELAEKLHGLFAFGRRRTETQDIRFSIDQLVEVAVRALSPGINDPFTAMTCLDHLGAALVHLAERRIPSPYRYGEDGALRVIAPSGLSFRHATDAAFNQIRQNSASVPAVSLRLLEVIAAVMELTHTEEQRAALLHHATLIRQGSCEEISLKADREDLDERFERVIEILETQRRSPDFKDDSGAPCTRTLAGTHRMIQTAVYDSTPHFRFALRSGTPMHVLLRSCLAALFLFAPVLAAAQENGMDPPPPRSSSASASAKAASSPIGRRSPVTSSGWLPPRRWCASSASAPPRRGGR